MAELLRGFSRGVGQQRRDEEQIQGGEENSRKIHLRPLDRLASARACAAAASLREFRKRLQAVRLEQFLELRGGFPRSLDQLRLVEGSRRAAPGTVRGGRP